MKRLQALIDNLTIGAALKEGLRLYFEQAHQLAEAQGHVELLNIENGNLCKRILEAQDALDADRQDFRDIRETRDALSRDLAKVINERDHLLGEYQRLSKKEQALRKEFEDFRAENAITIETLTVEAKRIREDFSSYRQGARDAAAEAEKQLKHWKNLAEQNRKSSDEETDRATKLEDAIDGYKQAAQRDTETIARLRAQDLLTCEMLEREEGRRRYVEQQLKELQDQITTHAQPIHETAEGNQ